jgi:pyridoxal phosphate enzyme (YggS family)
MDSSAIEVSPIGARLKLVLEAIEEAARVSKRSAGDITLVAVTKTHPIPAILAAIAGGATELGENRVQEAEPKINAIGHARARWHLIGHLQNNKARKAVQLFDCVQSLDSKDLALRLDRINREEGRKQLEVFIQVAIADEPGKSGVDLDNLRPTIETVRSCGSLNLRGLMTLPPYFEDPEDARPYFRKLRHLRDILINEAVLDGGSSELSMGMSHDFAIAIEEGATLVRVGTAIFGNRGN